MRYANTEGARARQASRWGHGSGEPDERNTGEMSDMTMVEKGVYEVVGDSGVAYRIYRGVPGSPELWGVSVGHGSWLRTFGSLPGARRWVQER